MINPISSKIINAKIAVFVDLYIKNQELLTQAKQLSSLNKDLKAQKLLSEYSLSLIEASHNPLFAINSDGNITDLNNATVDATGISREHLFGSNFTTYFTKPAKAKKLYLKVFENEAVTNLPLVMQHHDGTLIDILFSGSVYKDEKGKVMGVVLIARDVTDEKRTEKEMTEAKVFAELATLIAEEAKLKAEEAVKAKQQFLSNMSHEIRTPMNAIIGFTKVLTKTELSIKQKEYFNAIRVSGEALIVLIDDILDLAKVESGQMKFEQNPFEIESALDAMLHLFENHSEEKNLTLVKSFDKKIPKILVGDSVRLYQVIVNLVSNAIKFTREGRMTVSTYLLAEDTTAVTI